MRDGWRGVTKLWYAEAQLRTPVLIVAGLLLIFGLIAQAISGDEPIAFDRAVLLAFRHAADRSLPIGPPWLQEAARDVTGLGSTVVLGLVLFAVAGYLFLAGKHGAAWLVLVAVLGGTTLNTLLKIAFARPRPDIVTHLTEVTSASFPSGHAALSAITYLTLGVLLAQTHEERPLRCYFLGVAMLLTFLIGVSRVYLGVHYPTDVLAGWCIGSAWALGCWALMTRLQRTGQVEPPGAS